MDSSSVLVPTRAGRREGRVGSYIRLSAVRLVDVAKKWSTKFARFLKVATAYFLRVQATLASAHLRKHAPTIQAENRDYQQQ